MFYHIHEDTGVAYCDIARAYTVARDVFGLRELWDDIAACKVVNVEEQRSLFMEIQNIVERSTFWFLRNYPQPLAVTKAVEEFAPGVKELTASLTKVMPQPLKEV